MIIKTHRHANEFLDVNVDQMFSARNTPQVMN